MTIDFIILFSIAETAIVDTENFFVTDFSHFLRYPIFVYNRLKYLYSKLFGHLHRILGNDIKVDSVDVV